MNVLFEEKYSSEVGRHLVCKKSFKKGDKVFAEKPAVISPFLQDGEEVDDFRCFGCCKTIKKSSGLKCSRCEWLACSDTCLTETWHADYECDLFQKRGIPPTAKALRALFVLRCVLQKEKYPEKWKEVENLSDSVEVENENFIKGLETKLDELLPFLNVECGMSVDKDIILKILRMNKINTFSLQDNDKEGNQYDGKAHYPVGCLIMNACNTNLDWILLPTTEVTGNRWELTFYARKDIAVGDTLSHSYREEFLKDCTLKRRLGLLGSLNFNCRCSRCKDGTELGTNFSGVLCQNCRGVMSPSEPLDPGTSWKCVECGSERSNMEVREIIVKFQRCLEVVKRNPDLEEQSRQMFVLIKHCGDKFDLHENHSEVMKATMLWLHRFHLDLLLGSSASVDTLYHILMKRAENCLEVLSTVGATKADLAWCECFIATAIIKYRFKSKNCQSIVDAHYTLEEKVQILKSIVQHLKNGVHALRLSSQFTFGKMMCQMKIMLAFYREKLREMNSLAGIADSNVVVPETEANDIGFSELSLK